MTHGQVEQHFRSYEETEKWVDSWIASKPTSFFRDGMRKLPESTEKVLASDGQYFEWLHCNRFFTIKPQISRKNRPNLFVPLLNFNSLSVIVYLATWSLNPIFPRVVQTTSIHQNDLSSVSEVTSAFRARLERTNRRNRLVLKITTHSYNVYPLVLLTASRTRTEPMNGNTRPLLWMPL